MLVRALMLVCVGLYGYYLTGLWDSNYAPTDVPRESTWRWVGYALIVFVLWRWQDLWLGLRSLGRVAVFVFIVGFLAFVLGGQGHMPGFGP